MGTPPPPHMAPTLVVLFLLNALQDNLHIYSLYPFCCINVWTLWKRWICIQTNNKDIFAIIQLYKKRKLKAENMSWTVKRKCIRFIGKTPNLVYLFGIVHLHGIAIIWYYTISYYGYHCRKERQSILWF